MQLPDTIYAMSDTTNKLITAFQVYEFKLDDSGTMYSINFHGDKWNFVFREFSIGCTRYFAGFGYLTIIGTSNGYTDRLLYG